MPSVNTWKNWPGSELDHSAWFRDHAALRNGGHQGSLRVGRRLLRECESLHARLVYARKGVATWVEGKGKEREEEADRAKSKTDYTAWIEEGGFKIRL